MTETVMWVPPAFFASVMLAGIFLLNQYYKLPGEKLVLWSRGFVILALAPVMYGLRLPVDPVFYCAVGVTAIFAAIGDARCFDVCAKYGGGVVTRLQALTIWVSFFLWLIVNPAIIAEYLARPLWSLGVLAALSACFYFAVSLRKCPVSRAAFVAILPVVTLYGANMVLAKIAMTHSDLHSGVFGYALIQSILVVAFIHAGRMFRALRRTANPASVSSAPAVAAETAETPPDPAPARKLLLTGALAMAVVWLSQVSLKNYAFTFSPNPAYVAAVLELSPVWALLFYRFTGHKEEADIKAGLGIMASAVVLSLLTIR